MSPAEILREIERLYRLLPAYTLGTTTPEIRIKEAEIRALSERFKAANAAIYERGEPYSKISGTGLGSASQAATFSGDPHAGAGT